MESCEQHVGGDRPSAFVARVHSGKGAVAHAASGCPGRHGWSEFGPPSRRIAASSSGRFFHDAVRRPRRIGPDAHGQTHSHDARLQPAPCRECRSTVVSTCEWASNAWIESGSRGSSREAPGSWPPRTSRSTRFALSVAARSATARHSRLFPEPRRHGPSGVEMARIAATARPRGSEPSPRRPGRARARRRSCATRASPPAGRGSALRLPSPRAGPLGGST